MVCDWPQQPHPARLPLGRGPLCSSAARVRDSSSGKHYGIYACSWLQRLLQEEREAKADSR